MGRLAAAFLGFYSSHCVTFRIGQILLLEFLLLCCCVCIRVSPATLMGFRVAPFFSMPGGRHWVYAHMSVRFVLLYRTFIVVLVSAALVYVAIVLIVPIVLT